MHMMDHIEYTPFFYLCERGIKNCKVCDRFISPDNDCRKCLETHDSFHQSIELLIAQTTES
jgi:RNA polymerase subunit RPABC4/transcription elongation factor Spt4